jgi:AbrB family looped-hinge helix DNA binding protein
VWAARQRVIAISVIGIFNGMNARIDKSGRIVVPKSLRERLGLKPNTEFELVERADGVLLRPVEQPPSMLKVEGLWVHQGTAVPDARLAPYHPTDAARIF